MAGAAHKKATYQDVLDAPPERIAELIHGVLYTQPRPAGAHAAVASALGDELGPPFRRGRAGPGGWILLHEPELQLDENILVPDMTGWRRERMSGVRNDPYFTLPPDWVCEVLSPSTAKRDKVEKLPIYAAHAVGHAWLIDPIARTLEVWRLVSGRWTLLAAHADATKVRAEPFDAVEIDLGALWADLLVGEGPESA